MRNQTKAKADQMTKPAINPPNLLKPSKRNSSALSKFMVTEKSTKSDIVGPSNLLKPPTKNSYCLNRKTEAKTTHSYLNTTEKVDRFKHLPKPAYTTMTAMVNKKLTWLTIKVCLTYGITWLPSIVYYSVLSILPDTFSDEFYVSDTEVLITFFIKYITFFDAVLAPVIYCRQSGDFRRAFRDLKKKVIYAKKYVIATPRSST